jgi:triosephosphate isomerase (TIM)
MDKKNIVAGNWKMYKTHEETQEFIKNIIPLIGSARASVYLAVPFTSLKTAIDISNNTNLIIGAQNMHDEPEGAFTGEISGLMLKTLGVEFVIIGHSERRHIFNESNSFINKKVIRALKDGLQPILCIGETQKQREEKMTESILEEQLLKGLKDVSKSDLDNVIIAYEPVWAIGTGKTATPQIAENIHAFIRKLIVKHFDKKIANNIHILYGGSVKPANVEELMQQPNIDGVLVGGASLEVKSFADIVNKA